MNMSLQMIPMMECSECGLLIFSENQEKDLTDAILFGIKNGTICSTCHQVKENKDES